MPGITPLVAAISADVNSKLVAIGLSPLTDGGIVIGKSLVDANSAPPRVLFVPRISRFEPRSSPNRSNTAGSSANPGAGLARITPTQLGQGYTSAAVTISAPDVAGGTQATAVAVLKNTSVAAIAITNLGSGYINPPTVSISGDGTGATAQAFLGWNTDKLAQLAQRSLFTDVTQYEVHCWGVTASGTDPTLDFDNTQLLYQQVIQSCHLVAPGEFIPKSGYWVDAKDGETQVDVLGRNFIMLVEFRTPVLDVAVGYVPPQTGMNFTANITLPSGQTEQGFSG